jgi:hypothetical protein
VLQRALNVSDVTPNRQNQHQAASSGQKLCSNVAWGPPTRLVAALNITIKKRNRCRGTKSMSGGKIVQYKKPDGTVVPIEIAKGFLDLPLGDEDDASDELAERTGHPTDDVKAAGQIAGEEPKQGQKAPANGNSRPIALKPHFSSIPDELKEIPNWVMWRYEPPKNPGGKYRKVPYQVQGRPASVANRHTWSPFETCRATYEKGGYDGVGFVFDGAVGPDGTTLVGIDLDKCFNHREKQQPIQGLALERIKRLDTYTEASPSGTGLHMIARTEPVSSLKTKEVELYTTKRYFTFTGRSGGVESPIRVATTEVRALIAELKAKQAGLADRGKLHEPTHQKRRTRTPRTHSEKNSGYAKRIPAELPLLPCCGWRGIMAPILRNGARPH